MLERASSRRGAVVTILHSADVEPLSAGGRRRTGSRKTWSKLATGVLDNESGLLRVAKDAEDC